MQVLGTRCKILINSQAGAGRATAGEEELRRLIEEIDLDAEIIGTESGDQMEEILKRLVAEGADRICISGGDGTVSRAVQYLARTDTVLGIIPQGTANNFATALRLPMDLPSALRVLKAGQVREVDLGCCLSRYFTEASGVGLFADLLAVYGAGTNKSFLRGLYAFLRVFVALRAHRLSLQIDGKPHSKRSVMCTVANSYRMAEGIAVAPEAKLMDGTLNVVILGDLTRGELLPYYRAFRAQTHMNLPKTTTLRAKEIRIDAAAAMNVHCDDKVVGHTPVTISVEPRALKVLVDAL